MASFLDEALDNVGKEQSTSGFTEGTHKVEILLAEAQKDSKDRDIIKVSVTDPEQKHEGEATLWFHTKGGAKMSVVKVMGLIVHSVDENKKPAVKALGKKVFDGVQTEQETQKIVLKLINEKLIGKEGFFVVEPRNGYETSKYGDLWHYPATKKKEEAIIEGEEVDISDDVPFSDDL